jgi:hypothetical protein
MGKKPKILTPDGTDSFHRHEVCQRALATLFQNLCEQALCSINHSAMGIAERYTGMSAMRTREAVVPRHQPFMCISNFPESLSTTQSEAEPVP